ncbi:unnamed protein product [Moneuplotes crassus]|uniref:Uncharacterized protein n=1 Tax=Euplotes crassus TaxID=5936 RepID=A0AAD1Y778_EUPCR|nr:unnamed protein product [Moneuplotes crassus]
MIYTTFVEIIFPFLLIIGVLYSPREESINQREQETVDIDQQEADNKSQDLSQGYLYSFEILYMAANSSYFL